MPAYGWAPWNPGDKVTPYNYESYKAWLEKTKSGAVAPPARPNQGANADEFDAELAKVRATREVGMRLGFRSTYLIGPRGLEGTPWDIRTILNRGVGTGGTPGVDDSGPQTGRRPPAFPPNAANMMAVSPGGDTGTSGGSGGTTTSGGGTGTGGTAPPPPSGAPRPPSPGIPTPSYNGNWVVGAGGPAHPIGSAQSVPGVSPSQTGTTFLTSDNPDDVLMRLTRARRIQGLAR